MFPVLTPLVYHDPEHQMFMIHVPMELNIPTAERERLIGRMVQQVMGSLPESAPKGYLLQPETILTLQTFMERVLETEGITKEMIERQRAQVELVNTLATAGSGCGRLPAQGSGQRDRRDIFQYPAIRYRGSQPDRAGRAGDQVD